MHALEHAQCHLAALRLQRWWFRASSLPTSPLCQRIQEQRLEKNEPVPSINYSRPGKIRAKKFLQIKVQDWVALNIIWAQPNAIDFYDYLSFRNTKLSLARTQYLFNILPSYKRLCSLNFNSIRLGETDISALVRVLPWCAKLTSVDFGWNDFKAKEMQVLADVLPQCLALTSLNLTGNFMGVEGARVLAAALPNCLVLRELRLGANTLGKEGIHLIFAAVVQRTAPIALNLTCNYMNLLEGMGEVQVLGHHLIAALELDSNYLTDIDIALFITQLPLCSALSLLDLSHNNLGALSAHALAAVLPQCSALADLNLASNNWRNEGALAFSTALPRCRVLKEFILVAANVASEGLTALLAVLPQCRTLQTLDVRFNDDSPETKKNVRNAKIASPHIIIEA